MNLNLIEAPTDTSVEESMLDEELAFLSGLDITDISDLRNVICTGTCA